MACIGGPKEKGQPWKITRGLNIVKWSEAFHDFLYRVIGAGTIPLAYVVRAEVTVPAPAPPVAANQLYSTEHESMEGELISRASHTHPLYWDDNFQNFIFCWKRPPIQRDTRHLSNPTNARRMVVGPG